MRLAKHLNNDKKNEGLFEKYRKTFIIVILNSIL